VTITNVASFLWQQRVVVPVHGFGKVAADIAYGGNWFAFVEADQLGLAVEKSHLPVLLQAATAVREALVREGVRGVHPEHGGDEVVDHVKLFAPIAGVEHGARAMTLCPGTAYDRSPCGTGTSAKLAVLHAKGELRLGEWFTSESVLGTRFRARIVGETTVGSLPAIVPEIEGSAFVTGMATFVLDPDDPFAFGI
jgi:proline racemase